MAKYDIMNELLKQKETQDYNLVLGHVWMVIHIHYLELIV